MNYVINCSPGHAAFIPHLKSDQPVGGRIGIVSKKKELGLDLQEKVILMDTLPYSDLLYEEKKDWYLFKYKGIIKSSDKTRPARLDELNPAERNEYDNSRKKKNNKEPINFFMHEYEIVIKDTFDENPFLDDYTFSLQGIFNYSHPYRHFSRKFTNIDDFDYETLQKELLFASRTVFGRLFHSLPIENQLEFLQIAIEEYKTTDFSIIPISQGVEFLYDYTKRITQLGKILRATDILLKENFTNILDTKEVGFEYLKRVIDKNRTKMIPKGDLIEKQVSLFNQAFEYENGVRETVEMVTNTTQKNKDIRFIEKFKDKTWPIKIDL